MSEIDGLTAHIQYLTRQLAAVTAERDALRSQVEALRASLAAIHCRLKFGHKIDSHTISTLIVECETAVPELVGIAIDA